MTNIYEAPKTMSDFNLADFTSKSPQSIYSAQKKLEAAIEAYGMACDAYGIAEGEYRLGLSKEIMALKKAGEPVSIIGQMANGLVSALKTKSLIAEGQVKKLRFLIEAYTQRINAIKFIARGAETLGG